MVLLARFFSLDDIFLAPLCLIILYAIIRSKAEKQTPQLRNIYYRAFYFKIFCVLAYTFVTEVYFKGGDTGLYYQGVNNLRQAIDDDFNNTTLIIKTLHLDMENPLTPYFYYDYYTDDFTFNYMLTASNFFVPRLGLIPSAIFFNSYLCINFFFGFFALGGAIRLFKTFHYFYPKYTKELAVAAIFIPSVGFWSAGLLKDPICFGCIGYILYGLLNVFIKKKNIKTSILLILLCGYLLYYIKVYILLTLVLAISVWLFAETNKLIADRTLRTVFSIITLLLSFLIAYLMLNYFTSNEAAKNFKLETLFDQAEKQRRAIESVQIEGGSGFKVNASNPVSLVLNSIATTFFRPFLWEVNTPIALFSAIESLLFLILSLYFVFKRGLGKYFRVTFSDPRMLMCFIFSIVFAVAIGASTNNFGALSRYKIPCMPFYFITLLLLYKKTSLEYPKWFNRVLNIAK